MIIIGVDPGYDKFGVAVVDNQSGGDELLYSGCIRTSAKTTFSERLLSIGKEFQTLIDKFKPQALAIEKLFFTTNQKTAMGVSEAKGMATYIAMANGLKVFEFTPLQMKMAIVGYGKAEKSQVSKMIPFLIKNWKTIDKKKVEDDEFDAIGMALTGLATYRGLAK
ncbi:MAG: crossover junction endodeoxyribonuclease RuvC [bacterium]